MANEDRALLARLARVNRHLGEVVLRVTARQDGGQLHPDDPRALGEHLHDLGGDMIARANERA